MAVMNDEINDESNAHGGDLELARCVVCAGLWPQLARLVVVEDWGASGDGKRRRRLSMVDKQGTDMFVHPVSSNFRTLTQRFSVANQVPVKQVPKFACFHKCVATSKPFLHDLTFVGKYALLLFATGTIAITSSSSDNNNNQDGGDGNGNSRNGVGGEKGGSRGSGGGGGKRTGGGDGERDTVVLDGWVRLHIPEHGAVLCKLLRAEVELALQRRIRRPASEGQGGAVGSGGVSSGLQVGDDGSRSSALALAAVRKLIHLDKYGSYSG
jgi:hypothetical protein